MLFLYYNYSDCESKIELYVEVKSMHSRKVHFNGFIIEIFVSFFFQFARFYAKCYTLFFAACCAFISLLHFTTFANARREMVLIAIK